MSTRHTIHPMRLLAALFIFSAVIGWSIFISRVAPEDLVQKLGVSNGYLIALLLSFSGGVSLFTAIPTYFVVATLGAGGLNPILLGITAGIGVILGDSVSYGLGYHGSHLLSPRRELFFQKITRWGRRLPRSAMPFALFFYGALVPFPNNAIVITLGLARYPYWKLMLPLTAGNIAFNIGLALIGHLGFSG